MFCNTVLFGTDGATVATTVMIESPGARLGREQVSEARVQVQPGPAIETAVIPAGSASETLRLSAVEGPALCTARLYAAFSPARTVAPEATVLVIVTTELSVITVLSVVAARLESVLGSGPVTRAALTRVEGPASDEMEAVTRMTGAVTPDAREVAREQVMTWLATVHDHPVPLIDAAVADIPVGRVSVTTIEPGESDGPRFLAVSV